MRRIMLVAFLVAGILGLPLASSAAAAREDSTEKEAALSLGSAVAEADVVMRNVLRTVTRNPDGQMVLGVSFLTGRDANDRMIINYFFRVTGPDGREVKRLAPAPSELCPDHGPAPCSIDLISVSSLAEAESYTIEAGIMSRLAVLLMKDARTVQNGKVCESECASGCRCYPCSVGSFDCLTNAVSTSALRALRLMEILHLHEGWVTLVPKEARLVDR